MLSNYEVAIVGGGPAGLSAAVVLGRCRRTVVLIDEGKPRNQVATAVNGYLGSEAIPPFELRTIGKHQASKYGVRFVDAAVESIVRNGGRENEFELSIRGHASITARKILLATGVRDYLPEIDGLRDFYGTSVHHCPYCDGWEHRDERLVALGNKESAVDLAISLLTWSKQVTACTNGEPLAPEAIAKLRQVSIPYRTEQISGVDGAHGRLQSIHFADSLSVDCEAIFFSDKQDQQSELSVRLGCRRKEKGQIHTENKHRTSEAGIFVAGDADGHVQFAIVAAAEGATAATAINHELQCEDVNALQVAAAAPL